MATLLTFAIFFFIMFAMLLKHKSDDERKEFMHVEKCDHTSCKYCIDQEQCKI